MASQSRRGIWDNSRHQCDNYAQLEGDRIPWAVDMGNCTEVASRHMAVVDIEQIFHNYKISLQILPLGRYYKHLYDRPLGMCASRISAIDRTREYRCVRPRCLLQQAGDVT